MSTTVANYGSFAGELNLDVLAEMNVEELTDIYEKGTVPNSMSALDGKPKGRMLAIRNINFSPVFNTIRRAASLSVFPWDGKSFDSTTETQGTGINRINLGGKFNWFPFETTIEKSHIDNRDCIYLEYDLPGNPWFIRKIRDELREVAPGLFLGPAMWKTNDLAELVLWFAIDTNQQR